MLRGITKRENENSRRPALHGRTPPAQSVHHRTTHSFRAGERRFFKPGDGVELSNFPPEASSGLP